MASSPRHLPHRGLLWLVACGFFMQTLDGTIVVTALPAMARSLRADPLHMHAVMSSYLLAMALLIPASGWLADRYGTRAAYVGALAAFTAGSAMCAAAGSVAMLVAARIVQGLGGALLLPVGRLAVLRAVPPGQLLRAMSFIAVPALVGPLLGPTLGGWLVERATWQWIFLINLPIGAACALAALRLLPHAPRRRLLPFDVAGHLALAGAMAALALAMEELSAPHPRRARQLAWAAAGVGALAAYVRHAARCRHPLFAPSLLAPVSVRIALTGNLLCRMGGAGMPLLVPLLMQLCMGYTPLQAGLMMLPAALAGLAAKKIVAPLVEYAGYRSMLLGNTVAMGLTMAAMALLRPDQPWWLHALPLLCFGAVNSLQMTAINALALKDLTQRQASSGSSLLSMVQMLATGLGMSCAGGLLNVASGLFGDATPGAFRAAFVAIGLLTMASAGLFLRLRRDGRSIG